MSRQIGSVWDMGFLLLEGFKQLEVPVGIEIK